MQCENCGAECKQSESDSKNIAGLTPIIRLNKDAVAAIRAGEGLSSVAVSAGTAGYSSNHSARMLVDLYYVTQEQRKRLENQVRAIEQGADPAASGEAPKFMLTQIETLEKNAKTWLEAFAAAHPMHPWFEAVHGIGPVLTAGLAAHLGGRPVPPTVGHWWRFAGLDPTQQWLKEDALRKLWDVADGDLEQRVRVIAHQVGRDPETVLRDATTNFKTGEAIQLTKAKAIKSLSRIPFNRPLKTLCWKVGDQFVKLGNREDAFYAKFYRDRKAAEIARNESGGRAELARSVLEKTPKHAQAATYAQGKLPDGHVDNMARRATVKMFLSHLHELWYELEHGKAPPHPFATAILGHAHYIAPPHRETLFPE